MALSGRSDLVAEEVTVGPGHRHADRSVLERLLEARLRVAKCRLDAAPLRDVAEVHGDAADLRIVDQVRADGFELHPVPIGVEQPKFERLARSGV